MMASFMIGSVLDPEVTEVKTKENGIRRKCDFGILTGRTSTVFSIWDDNKNFDTVCELEEGEFVCAVVGHGVDKNGKLAQYLNRIAPCPLDLRDALNGLF